MDYKDFHIRVVARTEKGFKIQVDSPAGPASEDVELSDETMAALKLIRTSGGIERGAATREADYDRGEDDSQTSEQLGAQLYDALFSGKVGKMYNRSYALLNDPDVGLRIKFHLNLDDPGVSELAQIPWEYIYEADTKEYLTLSRQTPIVRYIEVQRGEVPHAQPVKLRILVVMSSPNGVEALDLEKERKLIESNWANQENVEVDFLEHPTPDTLLEALVNNEYHVLHYMGHGAYDHKTGAGALILEDENQDAVMLDAQALGTWLRDAPSIRLIFLNACDTARTDEDEPFAGVANRLVMAGVPAVLAMQFPITDEAAIDFAAAFYPRLVQGFPVDEATSQGRKAILAGRTGTTEWGTPVLYMRAPDGYLFDKNSQPKPDPVDHDPAPPPPPPPAPGPGPGNLVKMIGVAVVAVIAVLGYLIATAPDMKWEVTPNTLVIGKSTPVNVVLAYDNGSKSAYDDDYIPTLKASSGIDVSRPDGGENSWEWSATARELGSAEFKLEIALTDDPDDRELKTYPVEVTLMPSVEAQFSEAMDSLGNPSITTTRAASNLADALSKSDFMTPDMVEKLTVSQLSLLALADLRTVAETLANDQDIELQKRVDGLLKWRNAFQDARADTRPDATDELLVTLNTLQERLGRVNAQSIDVCNQFNCESGTDQISNGSKLYVRVRDNAQDLDCLLIQQGVSGDKRCKPNVDSYRLINEAGTHRIELRNREKDLILRHSFQSY